MPTYYVRPDGNDLNVGTAPTNAAGTGAWRTVQKAITTSSGGDTIWIAPGVYRENVSLTDKATNVTVRGDATLTQVAWGTGLTAGFVRISNNLTNDVGTPSGYVLNFNNLRGNYTFRDLRFDGQIYFYIGGSNLTVTTCTFYHCHLNSQGLENTQYKATGAQVLLYFDSCVIVDSPFRIYGDIYTPRSHRTIWKNCLIYVTENLTTASTTGPAGTISSFWFLYNASSTTDVAAFHNCTVLAGSKSPNYIFAIHSWNEIFQVAVRNCLILTQGLVNTFKADRGSSLHGSYNAAYSFTNSNGILTNSVTLKTVPVDYNDGYMQGVFNYLPYTPIPSSVLIGAGAYQADNTEQTPIVDFSGNAWNQANPSIGYMDSRQISTVPSTAGYVPLDRAIQTVTVTGGETGKSVHVYLGSTGVTFQTPNLTCYYARNNGTSVNIPLVAGNASTWVSGSLYEVSAVTMPGVYKFDIPNAVIESGATTASIMLRGANAFNGAFVNINIEQPAQSAYLSTNGYKLLSEYAGSDGVLTVNKRTVTTVKCQITDTNGSAVAVGSSTMTVEVYSGTNVLLASYTPTVQYGGNGQLTFVLDTQITGTAGTYNAYAIRTAATTDRAVFGPLQIKVNEL